uniref:AlNc14C91G5686 protein n=1 Tax=Albugo laibachii Nc14 TaxID=890382 RepID=F0WGF4_9STRA|nr:AlNc14C91G5686 [Albugo laibachii Nc14]|eukprot:CCA20315.1 AlNc14C91G5686 [Albugo laibachii Nc14]
MELPFQIKLAVLLAGLLAIPSSAAPKPDWIVPTSAAQASNDSAVDFESMGALDRSVFENGPRELTCHPKRT